MIITDVFHPQTRDEWRQWLEAHGTQQSEIWLLFEDTSVTQQFRQLDAIEEALCFGWREGIVKRISTDKRVQRFAPRTRTSPWSELNKERARRLIKLGLMTGPGFLVLPDLNQPFTVSAEVLDALKAAPGAYENFQRFPALYRRVRVGYIEAQRTDFDLFKARLQHFVQQTQADRMFGNWNDKGRLLELGEYREPTKTTTSRSQANMSG